MTTEAATKLKKGDMISARWRHGNHWPGWYVAKVSGVFLNRSNNQIVVRVTYEDEHEREGGNGKQDQQEDLNISDLQVPVLGDHLNRPRRGEGGE
jgi:hypothetical protein